MPIEALGHAVGSEVALYSSQGEELFLSSLARRVVCSLKPLWADHHCQWLPIPLDESRHLVFPHALDHSAQVSLWPISIRSIVN